VARAASALLSPMLSLVWIFLCRYLKAEVALVLERETHVTKRVFTLRLVVVWEEHTCVDHALVVHLQREQMAFK
jgi:hypothetical protein